MGSGLTAFTLGNGPGWIAFLYVTRFIRRPAGIGGEYAAINSAIDELIPCPLPWPVYIAVNGTYWAGVIIGTLGTYIFLNPLMSVNIGWRLVFLLGPVLGLVIIFVPRPPAGEPSLQVMHGYERQNRDFHRLHRARGVLEQGGRPAAPVW